MIYNDRVIIFEDILEEGYLGPEIIGSIKKIVPCQVGRLSSKDQIGIFGKYNFQAFKLHIQGVHKDVKKLIYDGKERNVLGVNINNNTTVVVVE